MTGTAPASPQRTLTLEITKTCRRKNGLGPRSVKIVITETQTMSAAVDRYPMRSWRTYSPRTSDEEHDTEHEIRAENDDADVRVGTTAASDRRTTTASVPDARSTRQNAMIFSVRENASRGTAAARLAVAETRALASS